MEKQLSTISTLIVALVMARCVSGILIRNKPQMHPTREKCTKFSLIDLATENVAVADSFLNMQRSCKFSLLFTFVQKIHAPGKNYARKPGKRNLQWINDRVSFFFVYTKAYVFKIAEQLRSNEFL